MFSRFCHLLSVIASYCLNSAIKHYQRQRQSQKCASRINFGLVFHFLHLHIFFCSSAQPPAGEYIAWQFYLRHIHNIVFSLSPSSYFSLQPYSATSWSSCSSWGGSWGRRGRRWEPSRQMSRFSSFSTFPIKQSFVETKLISRRWRWRWNSKPSVSRVSRRRCR